MAEFVAERANPLPDAAPRPETGSATATVPAVRTNRLASIDALRGFDMFWIVGGRELVLAAAAVFVYPVPQWLDYQLEHVPWNQFSFSAWDLIMPLFLFVSGAALPFSMTKWGQQGRAGFYLRLVRRLAILWLLGMAIQGNLLQWDLERLKLYSNTLQAIAAGYLISTIFLLTLSFRGQIAATASLFIGYWVLLEFVPYPGHQAGIAGPWDNIAKYVDTLVLGGFADTWHYTWVLSSLGFGGTVMMGVFAGHVLRGERTEQQKLALLLGIGLVSLALGWVWGYQHAFNKYIWSSSMNLWACGWCFLLLALFYWIIDIRGYRAWAFPMIILGVNAIAVYTATHLFDFGLVSGVFLDSLVPRLGRFGAFLGAFGAFLVPWLILYYMWRKQTFIRL